MPLHLHLFPPPELPLLQLRLVLRQLPLVDFLHLGLRLHDLGQDLVLVLSLV